MGEGGAAASGGSGDGDAPGVGNVAGAGETGTARDGNAVTEGVGGTGWQAANKMSRLKAGIRRNAIMRFMANV